MALQQSEAALRGGVGLGQHRGRGLLQDLGAGEVGGFLREVGVGDGALGGRGVFVGDAQAVDRRADRELLERAQPAAEAGDLLDRLVDDLLRADQAAAAEASWRRRCPGELRNPTAASPRLPVETDWMPMLALSVSVTFEPRAKVAPPPVMPKVLVLPAVEGRVESVNSTSRLLSR